jgi:CHAT domain-containing protein
LLLVVLSACETGLYDINRSPDEFIGLPGTFMALGAAGVVGTLWPVDHRPSDLQVLRLLPQRGAPPPTALKRAQAWGQRVRFAAVHGSLAGTNRTFAAL